MKSNLFSFLEAEREIASGSNANRGMKWTIEEENILMELIDENKNVLLKNSKTQLSSVMKRNCWDHITRTLNDRTTQSRHREVKQVIWKWKTVSKQLRKEKGKG